MLMHNEETHWDIFNEIKQCCVGFNHRLWWLWLRPTQDWNNRALKYLCYFYPVLNKAFLPVSSVGATLIYLIEFMTDRNLVSTAHLHLVSCCLGWAVVCFSRPTEVGFFFATAFFKLPLQTICFCRQFALGWWGVLIEKAFHFHRRSP